jgi:hypothetical protein
MFLSLISPTEEHSYDLLSWAFEAYTLSIIPAAAADTINTKKKLPPNFAPLNDLMASLANHFRSSAPLVRYGACLLLHSALTLSVSLLKENAHLFIFIATGLLDTDYLSSFLYLAMAENMGTPESIQIKQITNRWRQFGNNLEHSTSMIQILELVVKVSPPLSTKLLQKMASSLEYLSKPLKLRQLELIRVWGIKADKVNMILLSILSSSTCHLKFLDRFICSTNYCAFLG